MTHHIRVAGATPARSRHKLAAAVGVGAFAIVSLGTGASAAVVPRHHAPSPTLAAAKPSKCDLAPPSLVNSTMGLHVGKPKVVRNGPVTECLYPQGSDTSKVIVRFQTKVTGAQFAAGRTTAKKDGAKVTTLSNFKPYPAYLITFSSKLYSAYGVNVLKHGIALEDSTSSSTAAKLEKLMQKLLPKV